MYDRPYGHLLPSIEEPESSEDNQVEGIKCASNTVSLRWDNKYWMNKSKFLNLNKILRFVIVSSEWFRSLPSWRRHLLQTNSERPCLFNLPVKSVMVQMSSNQDFNVFVGAETGLFKGV